MVVEILFLVSRAPHDAWLHVCHLALYLPKLGESRNDTFHFISTQEWDLAKALLVLLVLQKSCGVTIAYLKELRNHRQQSQI